MKKTLVALAVTAFAASASAITVYENEGSTVDFNGQLRVLLEKVDSKTGDVKEKRGHSNLRNDGSRFGVTLKHGIAEDFYALGRLEFRFNGGKTSADGFGDLFAHRAYAGLGSKQYGELTFGRQATIGDDIAQSGFDNEYGVKGTTLTDWGKSVIRYDYKGIEGLQVGLGYRFAEDRDAQGEVAQDALKSGYDAGVTYAFNVAEGQSAKVAAGFSRDNFVTGTATKHHRDAWTVGGKYTINQLTLAADYFGEFDKEGDSKDRLNGFRVGAKYEVTPAVAVYGNYGHAVSKAKLGNETTDKTTYNRFMLGTSYKLHKNVFTFVEGSVTTAKPQDGEKTTNRAIGAGLRVFW
ncbi:hypothetical protein A1D22_10805 [Pasteurellaceae bacterium LFhippo2]|nr:hypothetical protein [Pasteurellaceae bacterium LFhippo2]